METFTKSPLLPLLLVLPILLGGCIWNRTRVNDPTIRDRAAAVVPGKTTAAELSRILGAMPGATVPLSDGRTLCSFGYGDAKTEGLSLLIVTLTRTNSYFSAIYAVIGADGIVESIHTSPKEEDLPWEFWPFGAE